MGPAKRVECTYLVKANIANEVKTVQGKTRRLLGAAAVSFHRSRAAKTFNKEPEGLEASG